MERDPIQQIKNIFAARIGFAELTAPDALDILENTQVDVIHIVEKLLVELRDAQAIVKSLDEHADDAIEITRDA